MGGVNTGGEDIYEVNGRPSHRTQYMQIDGRGKQMTLPEMPHEVRKISDGGNTSYTHVISNVNTTWELPVKGAEYIIIVQGNTAYCRMGGAGVVATAAIFDFPVADGVWTPPITPGFTHMAFIGPGAAPAGTITFLLQREP